jgi:hypothetical protein
MSKFFKFRQKPEDQFEETVINLANSSEAYMLNSSGAQGKDPGNRAGQCTLDSSLVKYLSEKKGATSEHLNSTTIITIPNILRFLGLNPALGFMHYFTIIQTKDGKYWIVDNTLCQFVNAEKNIRPIRGETVGSGMGLNNSEMLQKIDKYGYYNLQSMDDLINYVKALTSPRVHDNIVQKLKDNNIEEIINGAKEKPFFDKENLFKE